MIILLNFNANSAITRAQVKHANNKISLNLAALIFGVSSQTKNKKLCHLNDEKAGPKFNSLNHFCSLVNTSNSSIELISYLLWNFLSFFNASKKSELSASPASKKAYQTISDFNLNH
jgi:hypothetical protein